MDQFEKFISKHGETVAQAVIENWEQTQGIKNILPLPLEERWDRFLQETSILTAFDA